jgi:hypothetical protein
MYGINHNIRWFQLCRLTVSCIVYWYSLRHPDDGRKYNQNMLVIINMSKNTLDQSAFIGLLYIII